MKIVKVLIATVMVYLSLPVFAEDESVEQPNTSENITVETTPGFISDKLFIFTHAGAGKNYRILGRLAAGSEIKVTGNAENDFSQILDDRDRTVWIESQYLSTTPGLQIAIEKLTGRHATLGEKNEQLMLDLADAESRISELTLQKSVLTDELSAINKVLTDTKSKLRDQDTNIKKEWFFNGAAVLVIGLFLGLILPRLAGRKRNANSWK